MTCSRIATIVVEQTPLLFKQRQGVCLRAYFPPRATRSISARTSFSTSVGRLSSSHDLSIGRSISRTRRSILALSCTTLAAARAENAAETDICDSLESNCCSGGFSWADAGVKVGIEASCVGRSKGGSTAAERGGSGIFTTVSSLRPIISSIRITSGMGCGVCLSRFRASVIAGLGDRSVSPSAIILRMDARISSIDGSFAR